MNIIGKWKVKEIKVLDKKKKEFAWKTLDEIKADKKLDESDFDNFFDCITAFTPDGKMETLMPIPADMPQSEIDAAIAEGTVIRDGFAVVEIKDWKVENGKNMFNTEIEGEIMDEEVSPWVEITENGDGIEYSLMGLTGFRLERIE